ncbi:hypothetical protein [Anabaena catenula]|uniref:Uncharacterized protein n=1 Tax=Anabaena catenula FACHB-362 TaxID=2692877 RepID=A0ABR8JB97_9NOST|nr:hypothetical protein [Anabaena catenula]MBD2695039.1 hypothetical protein [Anabaena catenula FACHB-362]
MKFSFISLYQETIYEQKENAQSANILLGTQTVTDSREQTDQDPHNFGTQTQSRIRETFDTDASCMQFAIIP